MSGLSETIQARLRQLGEAFLKELPRRMDDISRAAKHALDERCEGPGLSELRHHVHKLAGSAATFGFHHVTACAKRLEHVLDGLIEDDRVPDESQRMNIRMLVSELTESARVKAPESSIEELEEVDADGKPLTSSPGQPNVPQAKAGPAESTRSVVIWLSDADLARLYADRFAFYGFETGILDSASDLESLLEETGQIALVMDCAFIGDDPTIADRVYALREKSGGRVKIIFLSERDDFAMRLLGVRTGGSAFFSSPYDINRIIDTVDGLTALGAGEPYHILIVDDDAEQVSYHALILQRAGMITSVVSDPRNMFAVLIEAKPDLILMDMYMPESSGPELATIIRQQEAFVGIPIVFLSVETDQDKQFDALGRGADGFLSKPIKPNHLVTAISQRVDRTRSMRFFMERDSLTGLLNHTNLMESLSNEVQRSERVGCPLCFAMIDIDHFKRVNDDYGHLTGDRVLKSLARLLTDRLRKTDVIGRYGGEEFGIVMFNVDEKNATRILNSIREDFGRLPHEAGSKQFTVTFSCGLASFPSFDGPGPISEAADKALYEAKEGGRNRIVVAKR